MSEETNREVDAAVQAIEALFPDEDPAERFRRLTALLKGWPEVHKRVRAMRQATGQHLYVSGNGGTGMTYDEIGQLIGATESRARHIVLGITNPSRQKRQRDQREGKGDAARGKGNAAR